MHDRYTGFLISSPGPSCVQDFDRDRDFNLRIGPVARQALLERTAANSLAVVLEVSMLVGTVGMAAIFAANSVNP